MRYLLYLIAMLIIMTASCSENSTESSCSTWKSLGFEDKFALRLVLAEPYLYVCAGSDGLWRQNIRQNSDYEFLGLADTSLGDYFNRGVQDVLIHPENHNWLLVAFLPDKGYDHVLFRSFDSGITWTMADSGLQVYYGGEKAYKRIHRLLFYPDYVLGAGEGVYITYNFAEYWEKLPTPPGVSGQILEQHISDINIIWLGGESLVFSPLLSYSNDGGFTWQGFGLSQHGVPVDNAVYSIAFDPVDVNTVYVGMQGAIIKTIDSGQTWLAPLVTHPQGKWFRSIESDLRNRNHFWASAGRTIMETFDGGNTWSEIQSPIEFQVLDMLWDDMTQSIYVATERGIYHLIP